MVTTWAGIRRRDITLICLWLLFRRSREPEVGARVTTLLVFAYWTPFFYIATLYPQASLAPTSPVGHPYNISNFASWKPAIKQVTPVVLGMPVHANAIVGAMWVAIALIGYAIFRRGMRRERTIRGWRSDAILVSADPLLDRTTCWRWAARLS